ncbi:MAG: PorT family protein [Bacteroidales bacterium]|nr:PorT family protein [Bacteroidales bacterium]MBD5205877.1 PorT family protein [Bacteroidales bacterium]MBD5222624.1 PorT family protein [Bacteroidales bacterium]MBD5302065.1 PorT family protein [Bacteroides sp.]
MKKLFLMIVCLAVAFGASAKFRVGPTVGANFDTFRWSQKLFTSDMRPGFSAGLQCELMIPGIGFGIDFGLKYANRGGYCGFGEQFVWSSDNVSSSNLRLHTIQVPLNLRFKWTRMDGFENYLAPFVFGGPQFNFNVANSKCEAVKRNAVAVGLEVGLGVEIFKRFQLSGGYVWDMTDDIKTRKLDEFNATIRGWIVDFAVLF